MICQIPMDDEGLEHMCKLSIIAIEMIESAGFIPSEAAENIGDKDLKNMLSILARTAQELMLRNGIKPRFRVPTRVGEPQ